MLDSIRRASDACYAPPQHHKTRREATIRSALQLAALGIAVGYVVHLVRPLLRAPPPGPVQPDTTDARFGVPEATRRLVFHAVADRIERDHGASVMKFPGQQWSVEDDLAAVEREEARAAAARWKLSLTQVYLVLDEGIREHWTTSYGHPLPATITPLRPRQK